VVSLIYKLLPKVIFVKNLTDSIRLHVSTNKIATRVTLNKKKKRVSANNG
jgi:hypothetical protein